MIHLPPADGVMMLSLQTVAGLSSAATNRALNEGLRRFHNHGEGPNNGLLLIESLKVLSHLRQ